MYIVIKSHKIKGYILCREENKFIFNKEELPHIMKEYFNSNNYILDFKDELVYCDGHYILNMNFKSDLNKIIYLKTGKLNPYHILVDSEKDKIDEIIEEANIYMRDIHINNILNE